MGYTFFFTTKYSKTTPYVQKMDAILLLSRYLQVFLPSSGSFGSCLKVAYVMTCTQFTILKKLSRAGQLLTGPGHVTSGILAIGKSLVTGSSGYSGPFSNEQPEQLDTICSSKCYLKKNVHVKRSRARVTKEEQCVRLQISLIIKMFDLFK